VVWGVFALLELEAPRERANIRVDLLVTWPALCLLTVGSLSLTLRRLVTRRVQGRGEVA
jgi:hypothetical protein